MIEEADLLDEGACFFCSETASYIETLILYEYLTHLHCGVDHGIHGAHCVGLCFLLCLLPLFVFISRASRDVRCSACCRTFLCRSPIHILIRNAFSLSAQKMEDPSMVFLLGVAFILSTHRLQGKSVFLERSVYASSPQIPCEGQPFFCTSFLLSLVVVACAMSAND